MRHARSLGSPPALPVLLLAAAAACSPAPPAPAERATFADTVPHPWLSIERAGIRPDTLDSYEQLAVGVKRREAASGGCLSKAVAQRLTIRAVPDSTFVNPTNLTRVPPWPHDTAALYP